MDLTQQSENRPRHARPRPRDRRRAFEMATSVGRPMVEQPSLPSRAPDTHRGPPSALTTRGRAVRMLVERAAAHWRDPPRGSRGSLAVQQGYARYGRHLGSTDGTASRRWPTQSVTNFSSTVSSGPKSRRPPEIGFEIGDALKPVRVQLMYCQAGLTQLVHRRGLTIATTRCYRFASLSELSTDTV